MPKAETIKRNRTFFENSLKNTNGIFSAILVKEKWGIIEIVLFTIVEAIATFSTAYILQELIKTLEKDSEKFSDLNSLAPITGYFFVLISVEFLFHIFDSFY